MFRIAMQAVQKYKSRTDPRQKQASLQFFKQTVMFILVPCTHGTKINATFGLCDLRGFCSNLLNWLYFDASALPHPITPIASMPDYAMMIHVKRRLAPWLFLTCTLVVSTWLILAHHSSQPFKPFTLSAHDFVSFNPVVENWSFSNIPVTSIDPAEPNIMTLAAVRHTPLAVSPPETQTALATIRLVHGYNMPMCMKIKGYTVEPIRDSVAPINGSSATPLRTQFWRVTSSTGKESLWLTSMIRSGDFTPTGEDICKMAFPRVDIPDDPRWIPAGFTREDLRHPVISSRRWFHSRWNASRTDLLTFLRLRQPAWASDEQLSYVTIGSFRGLSGQESEEHFRQLQQIHIAVLSNLQSWAITQNPL